VERERVDAGVAEVVPGAGGHGHRFALCHLRGLAVHVRLAAAADGGEEIWSVWSCVAQAVS
jgi:hypothetical protein